MVIEERFLQICRALRENPTRDLWLEFSDNLKNTSIKYYSITYTKGKLNIDQDLTRSYSTIYDEIGNAITSIPIYTKEGIRVRGALCFLKGLTRKEGSRFE